MLPLVNWQANPSGRQNPSELAMGKERYIAAELVQFFNHVVNAPADAIRRLTARAAVGPDVPASVPFVNLGSAQTFILSIVPLSQLWL